MIIPPQPPPRHSAPNLLGFSIAVALALSPFLLKLQVDLHHRRAVASEFQSSRESILSRIEFASACDDLDTLSQIRDRYATIVPDREFRTSLNRAIARAASREAELKLTVSRHLDLDRHREETSSNDASILEYPFSSTR